MKDVFQRIIIFLSAITFEIAKKRDDKLSSFELVQTLGIGSAEVVEEMLAGLIVAIMWDHDLCNTPEQIAQKDDADG